MDFLEFFGLKDDPFRLTPDPEYFYPSEYHNLGLRSLEYSIQQAEGFCMITGEPGTGKTTLLNVFISQWKDKAAIALVLTPRLMPEEFISSVLDDLQVEINAKTKNELIKVFRDFLVKQSQKGKKVIIIVDEAQNLPMETLEELRLLSNLETDKEKLLQIVLVGQPELEEKLNTPQLRQLNQRITTRVRLGHLSIDETRDYINFRLIKAGKTILRFEDSAIKFLHKISSGIPRLINIMAIRALMAAYIDETSIVTKKHIEHARKSIRNEEMQKAREKPGRRIIITASFTLVLIIALTLFYLVKSGYFKNFKSGYIVSSSSSEKIIARVREDANLREAPSLNARRIGIVMKGQRLPIVGRSVDADGNMWYKVKIFDNKEVWISAELVTVMSALEQKSGS